MMDFNKNADDPERLMPPDPGVSRFQLIKDPKAVLVALGVMALAALVVVLPVAKALDATRGDFRPGILEGMLFFVISAVAFWLAWGKSHFLWRIVAVDVALVLITVAVHAASGHDEETFTWVAFLTALLAAGAALPRLWGVRRVAVDADGNPLPASIQANHFSIRDMFRWTTCGAILISTIRWGGFDQLFSGGRRSDLGEMVAITASFAFATLASMWIMLRMRKPSLAPAVLTAIAVCVVAWLGSHFIKPPDATLIWATLVIFALSLAFHYQFRRRGCRLVRSPQRLLAAQAEMPSSVEIPS